MMKIAAILLAVLTAQSSMEIVTPEQFGARGDCFTDDGPAIQLALNAVADSGTVLFARKCYRSSRSLACARAVNMRGVSSPGRPGTQIIFSANLPGIDLDEGCELRRIDVTSMSGTSTSAVGLMVHGYGVVEDASVSRFPSHGIEVRGSLIGGAGNANHWKISRVRITRSGGWGLMVSGADANAGLAEMVDTTNNKFGCIYEKSFLGNTWISGHCAGVGSCGDSDPATTCGIRALGKDSKGLWLNQYLEGLPFEVSPPQLVIGTIGGVMAPGMARVYAGAGAGLMLGEWDYQGPARADGLRATTVLASNNGAAIELSSGLSPRRPLQLTFDPVGSSWGWLMNRAASTRGATIQEVPADGVPQGGWTFPFGLWTGVGGSRRQVTSGAKPTRVPVGAGETVFATTATAATSCLAWVSYDPPGATPPAWACIRGR